MRKSIGKSNCTTSSLEKAIMSMRVIEVTQPGVDRKARWVKKDNQSILGYKQYTIVDDNGLVLAVETTAVNYHDSKFLDLLDKAKIQPGACVHADKAYSSQKHRDALQSRSIKSGIKIKRRRITY